MSFPIRKKTVVIFVFLFILAFGGWRVYSQNKSQDKKVETIRAEYKDLKKTLEVSGIVNAQEKASLRFLAGGKVIFVGAKEGDTVKKWQTVASIDKKDLEKNLQKNLNAYSNERIDFEQSQDNLKDIHGDVKVDRTKQKNENDLKNTVLNVELQDILIKNASLYAPFDGVLVESPAQSSGVIVSPTDRFEIVNPNTMYFEVEVDESDISLVKPGQEAEISLDAYPQEKVAATVESIAFKSSQTSSGTVFKVKMRAQFPNDFLKYRLGMNGTAKILLEHKDHVFSIPVDNLIERGTESFVEAVDSQGKIEQKKITTGLMTDEDVEVLSGLSLDDRIVKK